MLKDKRLCLQLIVDESYMYKLFIHKYDVKLNGLIPKSLKQQNAEILLLGDNYVAFRLSHKYRLCNVWHAKIPVHVIHLISSGV